MYTIGVDPGTRDGAVVVLSEGEVVVDWMDLAFSSRLTGSGKLVLLALARFAAPDGTTTVTVREIAWDASVSVPRAEGVLGWLIEYGYCKVLDRPRKTYKLSELMLRPW